MISIIMPVYNCEKYVKESILSVIKQSFADWELVVVNDGSRDGSAEIIKSLAESDARIKYFEQKNGGVSSARNNGLSNACGEYIMFLDADDLLPAGALKTVDEITRQISPDLIVHPALSFSSDPANTLPFNKPLFEESRLLEGKNDKVASLYPAFFDAKHNIGCTWSWVIKKQLLSSISFDTDMIIYEDALFALQLCEKANTIFCMPDAIYLYRNNPAGAVNTFNYKKLDNLKSSNRFIKDFAEKNSIKLPHDYILYRTFSALIMSCMSVIQSKKLFPEVYSFILADDEFSKAISWAISTRHPKAKYVSPCALKRDFARTGYLLKTFLKNRLKRRH